MSHLPTCVSSLEKYLGLIFWLGYLLFLLLSCMSCLYILEIKPCRLHYLQVFPPSPQVVFSFCLRYTVLCKSLQVLFLFLLSGEIDLRKLCFGCVWLFGTPWTVVCQASQSMGLSRQEYWSGLPFLFPTFTFTFFFFLAVQKLVSFILISVVLGDWPKKTMIWFFSENVLPMFASWEFYGVMSYMSQPFWVYFCVGYEGVF